MNKKILKLILDQDVLDKYNEYYFKKYPKRKKIPIERPIHPSINQWMILQRPAMNNLKQTWKEFCQWWIRDLGYENLKLEHFEMTYKIFMPTRRRTDPDNLTPKFIADGLTEAGFIIDDDGSHLKSLTLITEYDKEYPRTEIWVKIID